VADPCEHGNEPSGSIKGGEFVTYLLSQSVSQLTYTKASLTIQRRNLT